jgi:hypothetical protein
MGSSDPGNLTQAFIDYRPTRCRCNAVVHPHHVQCLHCGRRQNLLFEGLEKVDAENLMELVSKLQEEFRAIPYDYLVQHKLGKAYILLGKYDEARTVLGALLQKKTDLWDARLNLGILHACLGEKELAVTELEYWLRNNPHSSKADKVLRTICNLKNIPYEEGLNTGTGGKTGAKLIPAGVSKSRSTGSVRKKRIAGPVDIFLLVLILMALAGFFIFPAQSGQAVNALFSGLENSLRFSISSGYQTVEQSDSSVEQSADADDQAEEEEDQIDPDTPINLGPGNQSYLPLAEGNHWEYSTYDTRNPFDPRFHQPEGIRSMRVVKLERTDPDIWNFFNDRTYYYLEKNAGLYTTNSLNSSWADQICVIPYPVERGTIRTEHGIRITVEGEEDVLTMVGLVRCIKLHYEDGLVEWWAWYGKGVGMVRTVSGGSNGMYHVLELRDYELN